MITLSPLARNTLAEQHYLAIHELKLPALPDTGLPQDCRCRIEQFKYANYTYVVVSTINPDDTLTPVVIAEITAIAPAEALLGTAAAPYVSAALERIGRNEIDKAHALIGRLTAPEKEE